MATASALQSSPGELPEMRASPRRTVGRVRPAQARHVPSTAPRPVAARGQHLCHQQRLCRLVCHQNVVDRPLHAARTTCRDANVGWGDQPWSAGFLLRRHRCRADGELHVVCERLKRILRPERNMECIRWTVERVSSTADGWLTGLSRGHPARQYRGGSVNRRGDVAIRRVEQAAADDQTAHVWGGHCSCPPLHKGRVRAGVTTEQHRG